MSRSDSARRPDSASGTSPPAPAPAPDRLRRLGALVAVGDAPLPTDLDAAERRVVLVEAARLRRLRLIRWFARAIAGSLPGIDEPLHRRD